MTLKSPWKRFKYKVNVNRLNQRIEISVDQEFDLSHFIILV